MLNKTRKNRKIGGSNQKQIFIDYANKIKNKQHIDILEFKTFLDSVKNPLKQAFEIVLGEGMRTINEYALIYNANMEIHALFRNYDIAIKHKTHYPFASSMKIDELTMLEAYILHGSHIENIRVIIEQLEKTQTLNDEILFRYFPNENILPTIFLCSLLSSEYVNSRIHNTVYPLILNIYMKNENFKTLSHNYNSSTIIKLFKHAIRYAKPDFMISIYYKFTSPRDAYIIIFNQSVLELLMLQNNETLYLTAIDMLQYSNSEFIEMIIKEYKFKNTSLFEYLKQYKTTMVPKTAKIFFSHLATEIIDNVILPYNGKNVRLIIRSHGISNGPREITVDFPFNKLCYFVEKGKALGETCLVSRRTEELICSGNYDPNLICTESSNGQITVEDHYLEFSSHGVYDTEQKQIIGIYICKNGKVNKANVELDPEVLYTQYDLVEVCKKICDDEEIDYSIVDVLVFACRGYVNTPLDLQIIKPTVATKLDSSSSTKSVV